MRVTQQVYKCELSGSHVLAALADVIEVDGKRHAFCSQDHRLEWLDLNEAVASGQNAARPAGGTAPP